MIEICAIASGSNGNCYYVGNGEDAVLVDVGVSRRQVLERMSKQGLNALKIKAIFISHEHGDHYRGVRVLSKKLGVPVYMTAKTWDRSWHPDRPEHVKVFNPGDVVSIGSFKIHTFIKNHDAAEPCSFRIEHNNINVGVFTDIGSVCENVSCHIGQCQALFLESNYDEDMLWTGPYPDHLKRRVAGDKGHLSNMQAYDLLDKFHHPDLKVVFLSHLSQENNRPDVAAAAFKALENRFDVKLTNRFAAGDVFVIEC
jgi:phosphoribosyl 1,2-cyclic phosphodiesterase